MTKFPSFAFADTVKTNNITEKVLEAEHCKKEKKSTHHLPSQLASEAMHRKEKLRVSKSDHRAKMEQLKCMNSEVPRSVSYETKYTEETPLGKRYFCMKLLNFLNQTWPEFVY